MSVDYNNGFIVSQAINLLPVVYDEYEREGAFSPFFGSQLTVDQDIVTITTTNPSFQKIKLKFVSTPITNKELPTGEFKISYLSSGTWTTETLLADIQLNHARNYSSYRADVGNWKIEKDGSDTKISIWFYNHLGTKTFTSKTCKIQKINVAQTNCVHYLI